MVLYRMFMSPRKIVSVRDEAYSRGSIRQQNGILLLLLIVGLACWPFSVKVACFLSIVSVAFLAINFISCIMDDEDDIAFNANGLGSKYIFKSDIIEVPQLDLSVCDVFHQLDRLAWQDILKVDEATEKVNKSINQALKRIQWGCIRDKVMWAQEEQKHLNAHTEEFVYYLSRSSCPGLSEPCDIIRTTLRNYADSLSKTADDIDKIVEINSRIVRKSLGMRCYHPDVEGRVEGVVDKNARSYADTVVLWAEEDSAPSSSVRLAAELSIPKRKGTSLILIHAW